MLCYPPKPTSVLPARENFVPEQWVAQIKYRGWRIVVHGNIMYTQKGNVLPVRLGYPIKEFDYQLDATIINPKNQVEHKVPAAIKRGTQRIEISDIYLPFARDMVLVDRIDFLRIELGIRVPYLDIFSYDNIFEKMTTMQRYGYKGIVIKRKDSIYKASEHYSAVDCNWVEVK